MGVRVIVIDEFAHAEGKFQARAPLAEHDPAPRPMGIEHDEQSHRAVAAIFVVHPAPSS
jgi:hypothetical protein